MQTVTNRQMQIIALSADGLMGKEIAARLGIAEYTVKNHKTAIFLRLGIQSTVQAVVLFVRGELGAYDGRSGRTSTTWRKQCDLDIPPPNGQNHPI